jgi:aspartate/methionine/tyrosine aminotransferase
MEDILFDGLPPLSPFSYPGQADRTVLIGSMSKMHRMIGWRVGWIAGPRSLVSDAGWVHVYNTTGTVSVARRAAEAVLRGPQDHVGAATAELQRRRDLILELVPGCVRPAGGWSLLVKVDDPGAASAAMLAAGVAATPMTGWGSSVAAGYVRFVFSAEPVSRLERLASLRL